MVGTTTHPLFVSPTLTHGYPCKEKTQTNNTITKEIITMTMITRTKLGYEVTAMVANLDTKALEETKVYTAKVAEKKLEKEVIKNLPENLKFVSIVSYTDCNKLFGLDETTFMSLATELDAKTRKPINA